MSMMEGPRRRNCALLRAAMIGAQGTEALGAAGMTNLVINLSVSLLMGLMLLPTTSVAAANAKNDHAKVRSCCV